MSNVMRILYMSCHAVLEYDELRILHQLGHDVTSIGGYIDPKNPHVNFRPPLNINTNKERINKLYNLFNNNSNLWNHTLTKEVVDDYDIIMVMYKMDWIEENWDIIKHKIVILRTIGQNLENNELLIKQYVKKGLLVLRYSPKERELNNYAGEDGLIRFLKYTSDFKERRCEKKYVITFGQSIYQRKKWCGEHIIYDVAKKLPFKLFGNDSDKYEFGSGTIDYERQLEEYATNSCYLYTGTFPAQYTLNFVEAMLSGIPIVSIGKQLSQEFIKPFPFEVPYILDEINGYYDDTVGGIVNKLRELLENKNLNEQISKKQIELATNLFSAEKNLHQWDSFLNNL